MPDRHRAFPPLHATERAARAAWETFEDITEHRVYGRPEAYDRENMLARFLLEYVFEVSGNPVDALVALEHFRERWAERPRAERPDVPLAVSVPVVSLPMRVDVPRETTSRDVPIRSIPCNGRVASGAACAGVVGHDGDCW